MALAAVPYETRIAEILKAAAEPMTTTQIIAGLKAFQITSINKSNVNSVLYGSGVYAAVPDSLPPRWRLVGSGLSAFDPHHDLGDLLPPDDAPADAYVGKAAVVAGEATKTEVVESALQALRAKGVTVFRCLVDHEAGRLAEGLLSAQPGDELVAIPYPKEGPRRQALARAHATACGEWADETGAACLCLVGPQKTRAYEVHHLLALFESRGRPVHLAPTDG